MSEKTLNVCFICLNNARHPGRKGRPPVATEKISSPKLKTFLTYILDHGASMEESEREDLKECITKACNDGELLLCSVCRFHVCKIYDMHLQLEAVQLLIINSLIEVKDVVQKKLLERKLVLKIENTEVETLLKNEYDINLTGNTKTSRIISNFHSLLRQGFLKRSIDDGLQLRIRKLENCGYDVAALRRKVTESLCRQSLKHAGTALRKRKFLQESINLSDNFEQNSWENNDTTEPSNAMGTKSEGMEVSAGVVIKTEMDSDYQPDPDDLDFDDDIDSNLDDDIDSNFGERHHENVNLEPDISAPNLVADLSTNYEHLVEELGCSTVSERTRSRSRHRKVEHVERELKKANDTEKKKNKPSRRPRSDDESSDYTPGNDFQAKKKLKLPKKIKKLKIKETKEVIKNATKPTPTYPSPIGPKRPLGRPRLAKRKRPESTKKWACDICLEKIFCKEMDDHLRMHPEFESFFSCGQCKETKYARKFGSYKGLVWHCMKSLKHPRAMECIFCPEKPMFERKELCQHLYENHNISHPKIKCTFPNCTEEFYDPISQRKHQEIHKEKSFMCDHCPRSFIDNAKLNSHINVAHSDTMHQCAFCPQTFKNLAGLQRHENIVHIEQPLVKCEYCEKEIKESALTYHVKSYHLSRKHYCM